MHIGVFDSGIGGKILAVELAKAFPDAKLTIVDDHANVPYGLKPAGEIVALTVSAVQPLLNKNCDVIVIACNTASAYAIDFLRATYPKQKFVGIEPMVKRARELTKSKVVAVCATPMTLQSMRYQKLKNLYAVGVTILEPDCSTWAQMIENNTINKALIRDVIRDVCNMGADVIVLGCTHYHWIKQEVQSASDKHTLVLEPSEAISRRIAKVLEPQL